MFAGIAASHHPRVSDAQPSGERRSGLLVDSREQPANDHGRTRQPNNKTHWQHDYGHAKSEADHHHDQADDDGGDVSEHAFGRFDPGSMPPHVNVFRVGHLSPRLLSEQGACLRITSKHGGTDQQLPDFRQRHLAERQGALARTR
jgi:hypothetical protein